ncbi:MAG: oligosaccharide flippase family protein [Clostridia bacterium]|nr:oligosaccharide flippase family protein [Clostridia bacterium]
MNRQIRRGVMLSLVAQATALLVNLVYTPLMIRILGQSEYGLYQLVQSVVNYLNLMNFGFSGAYISFYSREKAQGSEDGIARLNGMFLRVFLFIALLCVIAGAFMIRNIHLLGSRLTEADYATARILMILLVANLAVSFPNTAFTVYIAANERFVFKQSVTILLNVLIPLLSLPLLYMGKGSVGVVSVTLGLTVLRLTLNMTYALRKLRMRFLFGRFDKTLFASLFTFTFFIFLSDVVDQLNTNVDKFLLGRMMGTGAVAVYSVAFELKTYYTFYSWVVPEMFIPEANRAAVEGADPDRMTAIFTRIGRYNNTILLLVLTGFILLGKPFIALWAGPEYETSYPAAVILMLASYIPSVQTLGVTIQNARNMHRPRSVIYFLVACANVGISVLLIRRWGVTGTSLGTLLAVLAGHGVFMNLYYHFRIGLNVVTFWKTLLRWTLPAAGLCGICRLLIRNIPVHGWGTLLALAAGYALLYGILLWLIGLTADEKRWLRQKARRSGD